jgi:hypothetical protein
MAKICYITAIYGSYEATCKRYETQTVASDFICFTDNPNIQSNGWTIETTPYHYMYKSDFERSTHINSLYNNTHTFNIAKFYKQNFKAIPILFKYDVIVWLDGTIELTYPGISEYMLNRIYDHKIIGWHHEYRFGNLENEVKGSFDERYSSTFWNDQVQPVQHVQAQYDEYLKDGYDETFFQKCPEKSSEHFGVWITCFVAFLNKNKQVAQFLNLWYLQTLQYTTQDQIGFSYSVQKTKILPFTLPNHEIQGGEPCYETPFYIRHVHGI